VGVGKSVTEASVSLQVDRLNTKIDVYEAAAKDAEVSLRFLERAKSSEGYERNAILGSASHMLTTANFLANEVGQTLQTYYQKTGDGWDNALTSAFI